MDTTMQLLIALSCAAGAISFFAILRRAMCSPTAPTWFANMITAYIFALALTGAFAASLFFLGFALQAFMPAGIAFLATFVIHGGLYALCSAILPAQPAPQSVETSHAQNQAAGAAA